MSDLDSRSMRQVDLFGQKFSAAGTVHYHFGTLAIRWPFETGHHEFTIEVAEVEGPRTSKQHHVVVRFEKGRHVADPDRLQIAQGDVVTWNAPDAATPPFNVEDTGHSGLFSSAAMRHEAIYTHAFVIPGDYRWIDANGSALSGEIHVEAVAAGTSEDLQRWAESLRQVALLHVRGTQVSPHRVEVPIGGTVCWAVEGTEGVAIADARLVRHSTATVVTADPVTGLA